MESSGLGPKEPPKGATVSSPGCRLLRGSNRNREIAIHRFRQPDLRNGHGDAQRSEGRHFPSPAGKRVDSVGLCEGKRHHGPAHHAAPYETGEVVKRGRGLHRPEVHHQVEIARNATELASTPRKTPRSTIRAGSCCAALRLRPATLWRGCSAIVTLGDAGPLEVLGCGSAPIAQTDRGSASVGGGFQSLRMSFHNMSNASHLRPWSGLNAA